jgi:hypothetical protein
MITLDNIPYKKRTAAEIASDMADYINEYCKSNNVRNKEGDLVQIEKNIGNLAYILLYAMGYEGSIMESYIYSIGKGMNIQAASPAQLIDLAAVAGLKRKQPTHTTIAIAISCSMTAMDPMKIETSMSITYDGLGQRIIFYPAYDIEIEPGQTRVVVVRANVPGSFNIAANTLTNFDQPLDALAAFESGPSNAGRTLESISSLRARLQAKAIPSNRLKQASEAVEALEGVASCNVYFNQHNTSSAQIGDYTVPPRTGLAFVQGFNARMAETVYSYVNVPFLVVPEAIRQTALLSNGQRASIYFVPPAYRDIYVKVYTIGAPDSVRTTAMIKKIVAISLAKTIGDSITSVDIINAATSAGTSLEIAGASVGLDEYQLGNVIELGPNEICNFSDNKISIDEVVT